MTTRLVGNELDLNLASLAAALLVVIVVAAGGLSLAFDTAGDVASGAISGMIVKICRRCLVVVVDAVGHFV